LLQLVPIAGMFAGQEPASTATPAAPPAASLLAAPALPPMADPPDAPPEPPAPVPPVPPVPVALEPASVAPPQAASSERMPIQLPSNPARHIPQTAFRGALASKCRTEASAADRRRRLASMPGAKVALAQVAQT
jgi:hypothetical protein